VRFINKKIILSIFLAVLSNNLVLAQGNEKSKINHIKSPDMAEKIDKLDKTTLFPHYVLLEGMCFFVMHFLEVGTGVRVGKQINSRLMGEIGYFYSNVNSELLAAHSNRFLAGGRFRIFGNFYLGSYLSMSKLVYNEKRGRVFNEDDEKKVLDSDSLWHVAFHFSPEVLIFDDQLIWGIRFIDFPISFHSKTVIYNLFVGQIGYKF